MTWALAEKNHFPAQLHKMDKGQTKNSLWVAKENGLKENFSWEKFRNSLAKSQADAELIHQVELQIKNQLYPGISTTEIYRMANRFLKKQSPGKSARFSLKKSFMELGPSGFPFEQFMARYFTAIGYQSDTGQVFPGVCVRHEVDVVAKKGKELVLVECKFHNQPGMNVDVKVPLYINSRFQDLLENKLLPGQFDIFSGWIATNARFSDDAIRYARCRDISLIAWNFPEGRALKDEIDRLHLYPITCLTTLTRQEKIWLLERGLVTIRDLKENPRDWNMISLSPNRRLTLEKELEELENQQN